MKQCTIAILILFRWVIPVFAQDQQASFIQGIYYRDNAAIRVEYSNGKITDITRPERLPKKDSLVFIAPGFIDNQVNGYNGVSFEDKGLAVEDVRTATRALWKAGVTTYFPTLTSNRFEILETNFRILAQIKEDPVLLGSIAGFHLEGPYISAQEGYRGAHSPKFIRKPDWSEFEALNKASGRNIRQVTIAPELEGALDFIQKCVSNNITVAIGHHNASAIQIKKSVDNGASIVTHLGNGLANMINRHVNPLWPQLSDDRLMVSIICDGFHLLPEEINVFYKAKGGDKTIITSDATKYAGMAPGDYKDADGETIRLTREGKLLFPAEQVLYGSALPISVGVANVMRYTGCSIQNSIDMASLNPAKLYKLNDRGEIKPGLRADLIVFKMTEYKISIVKTIVAGEEVFTSEDYMK